MAIWTDPGYCPKCNGEGVVTGDVTLLKECPKCKGLGYKSEALKVSHKIREAIELQKPDNLY
jgi:DnaJ-class molecular chaperone